MPPKKSKTSKPKASRKRKSDEANVTLEPEPQPPKTQKLLPRLLPGPQKTTTNPDGTIRPVQEYSRWGYDGPTDFTAPMMRPDGSAYFCTLLPYLKLKGPVAAGSSVAEDARPAVSSTVTSLVRDQERRRLAHDRVACLRQTENLRPAVPSPANRQSGIQQQPANPQARIDNQLPQGSHDDDSDRAFNHLHPGWMDMLPPSLFPNSASLQNGYDGAAQGPDMFFSPGSAPTHLPHGYTGVLDPSLLPGTSEVPQDYNTAIPAHTVQGFDNAGWEDAELIFDTPRLPQELQPQPPSRPQGMYPLQGGSYPQQPHTYAPSQPPAYTNGYPPGQQALPSYTSPYPNIPPQQHHQSPRGPSGYPMAYAPLAPSVNVATTNIVVNHARVPPSSHARVQRLQQYGQEPLPPTLSGGQRRRGWREVGNEREGWGSG